MRRSARPRPCQRPPETPCYAGLTRGGHHVVRRRRPLQRDLEAEVATLAAHIQAATARLLALVAEVDRREAWAASGLLSCAHWLAWRTGLDLGAAREHVRVARALTALPVIRAAFGRGELSYSKVRAITRIARPETEADLAAMAREGTTAQLERLVRAYRRADPAAENAAARAQQEARWLHTRWTEDGMLVVEGRLTPEQGALLQRALEVVLREQEQPERAAGAEALPRWRSGRPTPWRRWPTGRWASGATRTGGDRVQVVVHVDAEVLADPAADGRSELEDGPRVPAETSRRLACDCSRVELRHGAGGEVAAGRKTRVISAPLRRALRARDGGCVFPGCTQPPLRRPPRAALGRGRRDDARQTCLLLRLATTRWSTRAGGAWSGGPTAGGSSSGPTAARSTRARRGPPGRRAGRGPPCRPGRPAPDARQPAADLGRDAGGLRLGRAGAAAQTRGGRAVARHDGRGRGAPGWLRRPARRLRGGGRAGRRPRPPRSDSTELHAAPPRPCEHASSIGTIRRCAVTASARTTGSRRGTEGFMTGRSGVLQAWVLGVAAIALAMACTRENPAFRGTDGGNPLPPHDGGTLATAPSRATARPPPFRTAGARRAPPAPPRATAARSARPPAATRRPART